MNANWWYELFNLSFQLTVQLVLGKGWVQYTQTHIHYRVRVISLLSGFPPNIIVFYYFIIFLLERISVNFHRKWKNKVQNCDCYNTIYSLTFVTLLVLLAFGKSLGNWNWATFAQRIQLNFKYSVKRFVLSCTVLGLLPHFLIKLQLESLVSPSLKHCPVLIWG